MPPNTYALAPEGGYPRLWRFVQDGVLPEGVLCTLDKEYNLLRINKRLFEKLTTSEQYQVLRTHAKKIYVDEVPA